MPTDLSVPYLQPEHPSIGVCTALRHSPVSKATGCRLHGPNTAARRALASVRLLQSLRGRDNPS